MVHHFGLLVMGIVESVVDVGDISLAILLLLCLERSSLDFLRRRFGKRILCVVSVEKRVEC